MSICQQRLTFINRWHHLAKHHSNYLDLLPRDHLHITTVIIHHDNFTDAVLSTSFKTNDKIVVIVAV